MALHKLLDLIEKAQVKYKPFRTCFKQAEVLSRWQSVVGPVISKHSSPRFIREKILFVQVDHPGWIQELKYQKNLILERINQALQESDPAEKSLLLHDIEFRLSNHPLFMHQS